MPTSTFSNCSSVIRGGRQETRNATTPAPRTARAASDQRTWRCRMAFSADFDSSIIAEALFLPWVAAHVVTAVLPLFPEAGLVALHEFDAADPFGALPGIEARDHQPQRIA